jgi:hypothetical protein
LPAIDDIADQINGLSVVIAQKIKKMFGLAATRTEMHIRDKQSTEFFYAVLGCHRPNSRAQFDRIRVIELLHCSSMTAIVNARLSIR